LKRARSRFLSECGDSRLHRGIRGEATEDAGASIGQHGSMCGSAKALRKLMQRMELPVGGSRTGQFGMSYDRGANPPLLELDVGRLTGMVCSGGGRGAESRNGAGEGGRWRTGAGSLRGSWRQVDCRFNRWRWSQRSLPLAIVERAAPRRVAEFAAPQDREKHVSPEAELARSGPRKSRWRKTRPPHPFYWGAFVASSG